ncbi:hypothetical protein NM688_g1305 [Phlebia brevispora]|uniref:Uncharacterized protein n=1 Tax=Phlebia brevispora TaxID=194682 RepID=A0ACC1TC12_9APHY|nr:hypothetical protein NM688_g1305 [Phlebia brevispora]
MPIQRLPQEISDMIIDFLHEDKQSLKTCSLVCRSWTDAAQYHILYTFRLIAEPKKGGYTVQLRPLLEHPVGSHIRELILTPGPSRYSPLSEFTIDVLLIVLQSLPFLRSLSLSETGFVEANDHSTHGSRSFRLKKLDISWMWPASPGTSHGFQDVLSTFDDVRELNLGPIHSKHLPDQLNFTDFAPTTRVRTLTLAEVSSPLVATLGSLIHPDSLKMVRACINTAAEVALLGALLRSVGSQLEQFQLAIWNFWFCDIIDWATLNLSVCPKLRSVMVLYANAGVFYSWDIILDILAVVPSTIASLTIVVREADCFNTLNWGQMERRLAKFTMLKKLSFRLCRGGDPFRSREVGRDIKERVSSALPFFKANNALCL